MEVIKILAVAGAGIVIGLSFGYVYGHNKGYEQSNEWHKKAVIIKIDKVNKL